MADLDLAALRALAEKATPGQWIAARTSWGMTVEHSAGEMLFVETYGVTWTPNPADAEFIAAFNPSAALALLARVEEAEARIADAWDEGFMDRARRDIWHAPRGAVPRPPASLNPYRSKRVLMTHPHNGHGENDICMYCLKGENK